MPPDRCRRRSKFVDVAPQHSCIASLLENAMTEAYYGHAAERGNSFDFANRIERFGLDTDEARALGARLRSCRPYDRCYSPACDQCGPVERPLMASVVEEFVVGQDGDCFIAFVTIVLPNSSVPKGSLHEFSLQLQTASERRLGENWSALGGGQRRFQFERAPGQFVCAPLVTACPFDRGSR